MWYASIGCSATYAQAFNHSGAGGKRAIEDNWSRVNLPNNLIYTCLARLTSVSMSIYVPSRYLPEVKNILVIRSNNDISRGW